MSIVSAIRSILADMEIKHGAKAPERVKTAWDRALVEAHARRNPRQYHYCSACGDGPWHSSWMSWNGVMPPAGEGKCLIGPCCSGAD